MIEIAKFKKLYKKIIVWGAGKLFQDYYKEQIGVAYLVDMDKNKWGRYIKNIPVFPPEKLYEEREEETAIIIWSVHTYEIERTIKNMGIKNPIWYLDMLYPNPVEDTEFPLSEFLGDSGNEKYSDEENVQILLAILKANKIKQIIVSPGATNITFVRSVQSDSFFRLYSSVDERSAAYLACGMAAECGEPVVLSCTGATASRNYMPGLTEAYYRKLPILAVTSSQRSDRIGNNFPQVTDRRLLPRDIAKYSVEIGIPKDYRERHAAIIKANKAVLELNHRGGGPVHVNLITDYSKDFSVRSLRGVQKIQRFTMEDELPLLRGKIGVIVGNHALWDYKLTSLVDDFCEKYDAVVLQDHTGNYQGKYGILYPLISNRDEEIPLPCKLDIAIYIGNTDGAYFSLQANQVWRVSEDGEIVSYYSNIKYVFEMSEKRFFEHYNLKSALARITRYNEWKMIEKKISQSIPELPFSNGWCAQYTSGKFPEYSSVYLGILNSLRMWNYFPFPKHVNVFSNTGGFGIEGGLSAIIGASFCNPNKMFFCITGDLSFFYDMNVLGNRHIGNNLRILLINNGEGAEFKLHQSADISGEEIDKYIAAAGHYQYGSKLVKHFSEDLGFDYYNATNKDEYKKYIPVFLSAENKKSIVFEIFTDSENEREALLTVCKLCYQKQICD